jgi:glycogen synthase
MNILMCSVPFRPSVGGIETVSALLALAFHEAGHRVTLLTQTPGDGNDSEPFRVIRQPGAAELFSAVRDSDIVLHNNISLRLAWPLLMLRRPWVVAHHTWLPRHGAGRWKRWALRAAYNVAVSSAVAEDLDVPCQVLPNPYDSARFRCLPGVVRSRDVACVGRLVSDKGVPVMLQALGHLRDQGYHHRLSVIGGGPERAALQAMTRDLGLHAQVRFTGPLVGEDLVRELNAHRVVVVPSVWEEPFGLVALEAQACGCIPVVAASGGLPQAAGPAGVVFAKGDALSLAARLVPVLRGARDAPATGIAHDPRVQRHLLQHQPGTVAAAYLELLHHAQRTSGSLARAA